jgi:tetratricopeptide (TPR) repeat protein
VQAVIATRQGQWHEAQEALEESIRLCRAMPYPYAEAKALYVSGRLHAAQGEPERAREQYQAALAICDRLGEGLYQPHIQHALRALDAINQLSAPHRASLPRSRQR